MKFLYGVLVFLALVAAALFLVPQFLDWERFKPEIAEGLEALTGRALAIDGPVEVSILPTPRIRAADLRAVNVPGAAAPDMARIASLDLRLALGPLLGGEIAVTSLAVVEPVVELQRLADGRLNWASERAPRPATEDSAAGEPDADSLKLTRLDSVTITNGTIVYREADGEPAERIEGINATVSARSVDGPFRGGGRFSVRGREVAFQVATRAMGDDQTMPISFEATVGGERGRALFEGRLRGNDGMPVLDGTVKADTDDVGALLKALAVDLGSLPAAPLASDFDAKGVLSVSLDAIAADELQLRLGESLATGALSWQGGDVPKLHAEIDLNRIDLDRFLPDGGEPQATATSTSDPGQDDQAGASGAGDVMALPPLQSIEDDIRRMIPGDLAATIDLRIGTLTWREGVVRQAKAVLALEDGTVTIRQASALLPGGADVDIAGRLRAGRENPWMVGVAEIAAEDLRAILAWLGLDVGEVPADRLRRLSASADFFARDSRLSAANLDVRVDTTRIAGDASIETNGRPKLVASLAVDTVNVDAYLPDEGEAPSPESGAAEGAAQQATQTTADGASDAASNSGSADMWAAVDEIDADVALTIDALIYEGMRFAGLDLDAALDDGALTLRQASVEDAAGVRASVTGDVTALGPAPSVDLEVAGAADSLEGVAALFDIDSDIRTEAFGKFALNGTLAGNRDALSFDLALAAGSAEATLKGTAEMLFEEPAAAFALSLRAPDAGGLARAAGFTPPPLVTRLGALSIDGDVDGDLDSVGIELTAKTAGGSLQVDGNILELLDAPSYSVNVKIDHPNAEALVDTVAGGVPKDATLGALVISGQVSGDRTVANFGDIDAAIGDSTLTGGVFLRLDQEPPAFSADLRGGVLDLAWLGGGLAATRAQDDAAPVAGADPGGTGLDGTAPEPAARWSDETVDLALLDRLSGTLALTAEAFVLGAYRIDQASVDLAASDGALTLRSLDGRLFDGALEADGSLTGGEVPAGQGAFRLTDAKMGGVLQTMAGVDAVSGDATLDGYFTLRGQTVHEMVQSLAGRVAITARDGAVAGVDVPAISRQIATLSQANALADIQSFIEQTEQSLSSGQTAIRSLDGTVRVQDGQARIDGFEIVADGAVGDVEGSADLPAWKLDLTALFRLTEHADAPPVGVRLEGPIDRPERRYLIEKMQAHLVRLGLLSLAGAPDMPKITLREGAKAEPGTEMDSLLREVLGDPDKAEDSEQAALPEEPAGADEAGIPADDAAEADGVESAAPSPGEAPDEAAVTEEPAAAEPKEAPADEERTEEPADTEPTDEAEEPPQADQEEQRAAVPADEESVPQPPDAAQEQAGGEPPRLRRRPVEDSRGVGPAPRGGAPAHPRSGRGEGESDEVLATVAAHQEQDGLAAFALSGLDTLVDVRHRTDGLVAHGDDHVAGAKALAMGGAPRSHLGNDHSAGAAVRSRALAGLGIDVLETETEGIEAAGLVGLGRLQAGLDGGRRVGDCRRELHGLAIAPDAERGGSPGVDGGDHARECPRVLDRCLIHGGDDVAGLESRLGGRAVRLHAGDDGAFRGLQPEAGGDVVGHRLDVHAEPAAHDSAVGPEIVDDDRGRGGGHRVADPHVAAGGRDDGGVHPNDLAHQVDGRAARVAPVDRRVDLQVVLVGIGAGPAPARGDNAEGRGLAHAEGIADGDHPIADAGVVAGRELHGRQRRGALDLEEREIGPRVAAHDLGIEPGAVVEDHGHGLGAHDHVIAGDDVAVRVDDEAGADAAARHHGAGPGIGREAETLGEVLAEEALEVLGDGRAAPLLGGRRGPGLVHDLDRDDRRAHRLHHAGEAGRRQNLIDRCGRCDRRGRLERAGEAAAGHRDHAEARQGRNEDHPFALG